MPSYKLMYFNSRGRAETSRMLFALAGQKYEDYRFKDGEWPGELKGNADLFPLGQAPVLIIDGKAMPHSKAIHRHLAREFGLYGANNEEARQIDVVSETVEDIVTKMLPVHFEKDEAKKAELLEAFKTGVKPFLSFLNEYVANKRFFVGNKATLADVTVYTTMEYVHSMFGEDCMTASWPGLAQFYKYITENSELAVYIRNRPETLGDVVVFWMLDFMCPMLTSAFTDYPALHSFHKGIKENSKLTEYLKGRPDTPN